MTFADAPAPTGGLAGTGVTSAGVTLGSIVEILGPGLLSLVTAPRGLDVPVGAVVVHDPAAATASDVGDVILAVGVDVQRPSAVDVMNQFGASGAAAVLLRHDGDLPEAVVAAATTSAVALLVAPAEAAWGQLHTLLRTALGVSSTRDDQALGAPLGDLFGLADALAAAVGGAVTIEDRRSTVLAYSTGPHPTDAARRAAILGRRVTPEWLARGTEMGVFRRLASTDEVISVPGLPDAGNADRLAIGVRAGGELLGSIWVQEADKPFGVGAEGILKEAASLAALHLLRARSADDLRRRSSGNQLGAVLDGRLPAAVLAEALHVRADAPLVFIGIQVGGDEDHHAGIAERLADFLVFNASALRRHIVATSTDRATYVLIAGRDGRSEDSRRLAADLVERASSLLRLPLLAAVVDAHQGLSALREAREDTDRALRVLSGAGEERPRAVHVDEVRAEVVLLQLRDLALDHPGLRGKTIPMLMEHDAAKAAGYVVSLKAFLDCFGDARAAAERIGVHPNTLRYRLRRLCDLTGLDLANPAQRLVVALQLSLLDV